MKRQRRSEQNTSLSRHSMSTLQQLCSADGKESRCDRRGSPVHRQPDLAGKNAAKDYAATTSRNSADEKSLINRVKVLEQYLAQARKHFAENAEHEAMMQEPQTEQEPQAEPESAQEAEQNFDSSELPEPSVDEPEMESSTGDLPDEIVLVDDIEGYQKFCAEHEGGSLIHSSGDPEIKFSDFTEEDKYDCSLPAKPTTQSRWTESSPEGTR